MTGSASLEGWTAPMLHHGTNNYRADVEAMSHPATLTWFAHHEFRLAWRDWWSMLTAGKPHRIRIVALALAGVRRLHASHRVLGRRPVRRHRGRRRSRHAGGHHRLRAAGLVADDVAGDGIGDARVLCPLRPRSDPVVAGGLAPGVRGADRHHGLLDGADGGAAGGALHQRAGLSRRRALACRLRRGDRGRRIRRRACRSR